MNRNEWITDLLLFAGVAAIVGGIAFYDWRAGMIVGGVVLVALGVLVAVGTPARRDDEDPARWRPVRASRQAPSVLDDPLPPRSPLGDGPPSAQGEQTVYPPYSPSGT